MATNKPFARKRQENDSFGEPRAAMHVEPASDSYLMTRSRGKSDSTSGPESVTRTVSE